MHIKHFELWNKMRIVRLKLHNFFFIKFLNKYKSNSNVSDIFFTIPCFCVIGDYGKTSLSVS